MELPVSEQNKDAVVKDFMKKYRIDLIEIPEEFKHLEVEENFKPLKHQKPRRKRVFTKVDRNLWGYDSWRVHDRQIMQISPDQKAVCKILLAPKVLKRAFGTPDTTQVGFYGSGVYDFEDTNLDLFRLYDYKKTVLYHGLPREDEFYLSQKNMKKPLHKRKRKWPEAEEFWELEEPQEFRLLASHNSEWRKFRRWLRKFCLGVELDPEFDYDTEVMTTWGSNLDICLGDFDQKGSVNTDMAVFKFTNQFHMTEEEIAKLEPEKRMELPVPPKMPDLSSAERIVINRNEMKVQEIQEEQEKLSQFI